jgi:hypothetical protein
MTAPPLSTMSPSVEVAPPEFTPYRYGLLSVAQRMEGSGRWELGGVNYTTHGCPNGTDEWVTRCPVDPPPPGPPPEKNVPTGLNQVEGKPFMLYDGAACYPHTGRTEQELLDLAVGNLIAGEQKRLEAKFWEQMRQTATIVDPPAGSVDDAWANFCLAVGTLDDLLAKTYGGIGVLHAPRFLIALATLKNLTHRDGGRLLGPADNPWAFGAGYNLNGPPVSGDDDNPAGTGQAWLYITGPVVLRRSDIQTHATFGIRDNERRALAERNYVLTADCPALAVKVTIPEC